MWNRRVRQVRLLQPGQSRQESASDLPTIVQEIFVKYSMVILEIACWPTCHHRHCSAAKRS